MIGLVIVHFTTCVLWDWSVQVCYITTTYITQTLHTQSQWITTHIMWSGQNTCWILKNSIFNCWSLMRPLWIPVYSYATYVPSRYRMSGYHHSKFLWLFLIFYSIFISIEHLRLPSVSPRRDGHTWLTCSQVINHILQWMACYTFPWSLFTSFWNMFNSWRSYNHMYTIFN